MLLLLVVVAVAVAVAAIHVVAVVAVAAIGWSSLLKLDHLFAVDRLPPEGPPFPLAVDSWVAVDGWLGWVAVDGWLGCC